MGATGENTDYEKVDRYKTPLANAYKKVQKISTFFEKSYSCLIHRLKQFTSINLSKRMRDASTIQWTSPKFTLSDKPLLVFGTFDEPKDPGNTLRSLA